MPKSQEWWEDVQPRLIKATPSAISQYKNGKNLQNSIHKWEDKIINSVWFGYVLKDDILESHAEAKKQLIKLNEKYSKFIQEYKKLGNHSKIILGIESNKHSLQGLCRHIGQ